MGEEKRRNRSWLWCPHSTIHKWSFHEDRADKERRKDKKHSWLRNGIAAPPLCLIQLLRMAFLRLCLVWVMSLSFSPSPRPLPPRSRLKTRRSCQGPQRFPSSLPWWNKIPCYAGKLASLFFTWAGLSHGQDKGSQAWMLMTSETCSIIFWAILHLFVFQFPSRLLRVTFQSNSVCLEDPGTLYRPEVASWRRESICWPLQQLFYFQGVCGPDARDDLGLWQVCDHCHLHLLCHH